MSRVRFVYPNAAREGRDRPVKFFGCGRLSVFKDYSPEKIEPGYKRISDKYLTTAIDSATNKFAPLIGNVSYTILESCDQDFTDYQGASLQLAYLLSEIYSTYPSIWDGIEQDIDIWCTGQIKGDYLSQVTPDEFQIKFEHFLLENNKGIFIVPFKNIGLLNQCSFEKQSYNVVRIEDISLSMLLNPDRNIIVTVIPTSLECLINKIFPTTIIPHNRTAINNDNVCHQDSINNTSKAFINSSESWDSFLVPGSAYDLISGIASTKNNLNGCEPSWFPPGDSTVILGAGAIDSATTESRTSATWKIQIDFDSVKHFHKGYLVIACQRLFGGLHSAKRGARVEIKLNDNYVDGFSLLVIPSGHSDYFHRVQKPSLPEPFSQWGTVYTWPIQKNALSTDGCQTVSVSIDKEASWDIDSVGIVCIRESNNRKIFFAAIIVFTIIGVIFTLFSLGIFYLKNDKIVSTSHLEPLSNAPGKLPEAGNENNKPPAIDPKTSDHTTETGPSHVNQVVVKMNDGSNTSEVKIKTDQSNISSSRSISLNGANENGRIRINEFKWGDDSSNVIVINFTVIADVIKPYSSTINITNFSSEDARFHTVTEYFPLREMYRGTTTNQLIKLVPTPHIVKGVLAQ